jgi:hypothetical protein
MNYRFQVSLAVRHSGEPEPRPPAERVVSAPRQRLRLRPIH